MLTTLEHHHRGLMKLMATMRGLIDEDELPRGTVTQTRLMLGRASMGRTRFLIDHVYPVLLASLEGAGAEQVRELRNAGTEDRMRSSAHIGKWTSSAVIQDWSSFRQDAAGVLSMMNDRIEKERLILYPLLSRR